MASYSATGLCGLDFPSNRSNRGKNRAEDANLPQVRRWHATTAKAVRSMLSGQAPGPLPPLDLGSGTVFQQRVWGVLRGIPPGATMSYAGVARAIGKPGATRAVGSACGANPIPLLIPCHRVLAAHGKLGGFSGGLHWKQTLPGREDVIFTL